VRNIEEAQLPGSEGKQAAPTCDGGLLVLGALQVLLHQFGRHTDDVLTLPVFHHVERLQRADDVALRDAGHLAVRQQQTRLTETTLLTYERCLKLASLTVNSYSEKQSMKLSGSPECIKNPLQVEDNDCIGFVHCICDKRRTGERGGECVYCTSQEL